MYSISIIIKRGGSKVNLKSKSILDTITVILAILSLIICTLAIIIGFYQHKFFPLIYVGASYFTLTVYEMLIIFESNNENETEKK